MCSAAPGVSSPGAKGFVGGAQDAAGVAPPPGSPRPRGLEAPRDGATGALGTEGPSVFWKCVDFRQVL